MTSQYFYIFKQKCVSWSLWPLECSCVVLFCLLTEAEKPEPDFCIVVSGTKRTGAGTLQLVFREQNWPFFPFLQWKSSASSSSRTQHRMKTSWAWKKVKLSPLSPGRNISPMNIKHRKNVDQVVHISAWKKIHQICNKKTHQYAKNGVQKFNSFCK